MRGAASVRFVGGERGTRLKELHQCAPLRVLFPSSDELGVPAAVVATTSGGLVGGDVLEIGAEVGEQGRALVTAQAAEKVYRSTGADCRVRVSLAAGDRAWLEWLPQETILFEGARLRRTTLIEAAATARLLAGEILVFGRRARGERLTRGLIHEAWTVRRDGRLLWSDAFRIEGESGEAKEVFAASACLAAAAAVATFVYIGDDRAAALDLARSLGDSQHRPADGLEFAATSVGDVVIGRWLAREPLQLRLAFARFWAIFRNRTSGLPEVLPRVWWV